MDHVRRGDRTHGDRQRIHVHPGPRHQATDQRRWHQHGRRRRSGAARYPAGRQRLPADDLTRLSATTARSGEEPARQRRQADRRRLVHVRTAWTIAGHVRAATGPTRDRQRSQTSTVSATTNVRCTAGDATIGFARLVDWTVAIGNDRTPLFGSTTVTLQAPAPAHGRRPHRHDSDSWTATLPGADGLQGRAVRISTPSHDSATSAQNSTGTFTVTPADGRFVHVLDTCSNVAAGATIPSVTVSAFDQYGNAATNYDWTGGRHDHVSTDLHGSSDGCGINNATPAPCRPGLHPDGANTGTANLTGLTGYKAESGRQDHRQRHARPRRRTAATAFTVSPADVASFTFSQRVVTSRPARRSRA